MKMNHLLKLVFLGLTLWVFASCDDVLGIRGKGDILTEVRQVDNFHALDISTAGNIKVRVDSVYYVEVRCEESIIDFLETVEDNGVLKIYFDRDVYDVDNLTITVSAPNWDGIDISGSANISLPDAISGNLLDLRITGSGNAEIFQADFNKIKASITGSGNMSVEGSADDLTCSITGSGDFDAIDCPVKAATVNISGSGDVRVRVSETLDVTISGSGDVEYLGDPQVTSNITGSGKVKKI
ncbi:MAG: DUF2807 domain-containing protein [Lewinellaceae bacterium]|nr:DUF2807 domain-containing protein [Saprospiraceae bacterium]MCB9306619.1 DUF2807 domain-containing protein [Lewinellaceae bacterium]MCB9355244.1 DUF2807 domain-containing protein [Lewinellaceae bacterium]